MEEPIQHIGTKSTFGPQVSSKRTTNPTTKFGTGSRTSKLHETSFETQLLGKTSPGPTTSVTSAFGKQPDAHYASAPAFAVPKAASPKPGSLAPRPGTYAVPTDTLGVQAAESSCARSPAYKLGTSSRWPDFKSAPGGESADPLLNNTRPATGYLGDAPSWTFHGPQQRNLLAMSQAGCPMSPTAATGPGPGAYNTETSAFGAQVHSEAATVHAPRVPRSLRDALMKQALPPGQEHVLYGHHSPGPAIMGQTSSMGRQLLSRSKSSSGPKFGTSDRFGDFKPKAVTSAKGHSGSSSADGGRKKSASGGPERLDRKGRPHSETPGPGSYLI